MCYFFEFVSERESWGTYCFNLLFKFAVWITVNCTLKPPAAKKITQLNTKLGFSVTHLKSKFLPQIFLMYEFVQPWEDLNMNPQKYQLPHTCV